VQENKIRLTQEKETLLVPLYSKAIENKRKHPIISDPKAEEILQKIEYNFEKLRIPHQTLITLAMRAKKFDLIVKDFINKNDHPIVLHLGCGLDSRILRVGFTKGQWYDLDYPDVIELRKRFYTETKQYHMIPSSVIDKAWINEIKGNNSACIIAEGLFMYLHEEDIRDIFTDLQNRLPGSVIAFDAYSRLTAKNAGKHPSLKKTGAHINWGIDDAKNIESWEKGIKLLEEWYFTNSEDIHLLGFGSRLLFRIAGLFKAAKKAHRILYYSL